MEEDKFKEYKKIGREKWGKDFILWKSMFSAFLSQSKGQPVFGPAASLVELFLNYFVDVGRARNQGIPLIMHTFNYGPELFYAMNLQPLMQELFSVALAPLRFNEPYIDITDQMGFGDNPTICNASRPLIGAYTKGVAPLPDLLFYTTTPCNSIAITYQVFQHITKIPSFQMDLPYWEYDPNREEFKDFYDEKTLEYVLSQIKSLISWIEKKTKQKFDEDKFKQTMTLLNQARQNVMDFNELLRAVPCPVNSMGGLGNWLAMELRGGTAEAVKVTKALRDEAASNVKNGIAGVPDEKIRIAWPYIHVFFDELGLFPWLEETFNAVTIMDLLGYYQVKPHDTSTVEKCFNSLAKGTLDMSMIGTCRGPAEFYIDNLIRWIKDYKIDCVIVPMQFACKHAYALLRITSEVVRQETGVPMLIFGCDPFDAREVPTETIRGKIADFLTQVVL